MKTAPLIRFLFLGCVAGFAGSTGSASTEAEVVLPEFENVLSTENGATDTPSLTLYNGHVGAYIAPGSVEASAIPTAPDTGIQLVSSAFGQPLSGGAPYADFSRSLALEVQAELYVDTTAEGLTREGIESSGKAFRYKPLLFSTDVENGVSNDFESILSWYGDAERLLVQDAIDALKAGLKVVPADPLLRSVLLDVYYDYAVAEVQFIKVELSNLAELRLGLTAVPSDSFIISEEVETYLDILERYRGVLSEYGTLLNGNFGVNTQAVDPAAPEGVPFGFYVFADEQPRRSQFAATFLDDDGVLKSVPSFDPALGDAVEDVDRELLSGYKDYALLLTLLNDYATAAAELARVYGLRRQVEADRSDKEDGLALISRVQQELYLTQRLLEVGLPDLNPEVGDGSGIEETRRALTTAVTELNGAQQFLVGTANALGFDPDFLVLIQEFPDSTEGNQFDSYDALIRWIQNTDTSPLNFAETTYDRARTSYETYRGFSDQVFNELSNINTTVSQRYFEITGYDPEEEGDHRAEPRPGSELAEIGEAIAQLEAQAVKLGELEVELTAAVSRATESVDISQGLAAGIDEAVSTFQGTASTQWDKLGRARANAAAMQAGYEMLSDVAAVSGADDMLLSAGVATGVTVVAGAANIAVQYASERSVAEAEKQLDFANAEFDAALEANDTALVVNQAVDNLDDVRREQISFGMQQLDNQMLLGQELSRQAGAYRELDRLLRNRESTIGGLADRYYADPVHYLRAQGDMLAAEIAFKEAQEWVFFTARALEFKWNRDFAIRYLEKDWSMNSLFSLRNFRELEEMVGALEQFNTINLISFNRESFVDKISIRDDILAPFPGTGFDDGMRYDLEAGEVVTATELMRRKLDRSRDDNGNIEIRINTFALSKRDGFFFLGPDYNNDGSVFSAGKYLDKIDWIKLNAVTTEANTVRTAILSYSGTCYVRGRVPPCIDPENPLFLEGEFVRFPFRYFFTLDNGASWETRQEQQDTVKLVLSPDPVEPDRGIQNSTLENSFLKERSVATTDFVIRIPSNGLDLNQLEDLEVYINHLFVSREVPNCN